MKVEIGSMKIKVNKKSLVLSLAESKLLFEKLNEVFGPKYNYSHYTYPYILTSGPIHYTDTSSSSDTVTITNDFDTNK